MLIEYTILRKRLEIVFADLEGRDGIAVVVIIGTLYCGQAL